MLFVVIFFTFAFNLDRSQMSTCLSRYWMWVACYLQGQSWMQSWHSMMQELTALTNALPSLNIVMYFNAAQAAVCNELKYLPVLWIEFHAEAAKPENPKAKLNVPSETWHIGLPEVAKKFKLGRPIRKFNRQDYYWRCFIDAVLNTLTFHSVILWTRWTAKVTYTVPLQFFFLQKAKLKQTFLTFVMELLSFPSNRILKGIWRIENNTNHFPHSYCNFSPSVGICLCICVLLNISA